MSTRRQFMFGGLAALAAGCATRLEPAVPNIREPFEKLNYGSDLKWTCGFGWSSPSILTTVGDGEAYLKCRRSDGIFFWNLYILIGSTTSFPNTGAWYFEFPNVFDLTGTILPATTFGTGLVFNTGAASPPGSPETVTVSTVRSLGGTPAAIVYAPTYDNAGGQLSSILPGSWAANDSVAASGWMAALDN